ncbi:MAG: T9SS type A sorting domain-containing protein [Salinivirgaceae bacterium]|jgi:hypothetical protein|nr:T9SS type A sorting domain-containing protein [Salinivirgaceae bacterium]
MKNIYKLLVSVCLLLSFSTIQAQEPRIVEVSGYDLNNPVGEVDDYNNVLWDIIYGDTLGRAENPNTIYMLKRNHVYPLGKIISNNFPLHIEGEGTNDDGFLPEIIVGLKSDGTTGNDYIDSYSDLTLKNIYFNGDEGGGAYLHRMIEMRKSNSRFIIDGCALTGDNSGAVLLKADSLKVYVRNSVMGNLGHRYVMNGNGRFIEIRSDVLSYVDTLIIENCLTYNLTDRIIRNEGSLVNYLKVDHLTALNTVGRNGGLDLANARKAIITNNVFANVISIGHTDANAAEQNQADGHFAVIALDTIYSGQSIEVRNNNIFWDEAIHNAWSLYDTVESPNYICSTVKAAIGEANVEKAYFSEPLVFANTCGNIAGYVANYYANPLSLELPDSWCVGGDGGLYYDEIDVSYASTYASYKADDNGEPVGCQLHFDDGTNIFTNKGASGFNVTCYPNPFLNKTNIQFSLANASKVTISVYDITGAEVQTVLNSELNAGDHTIELNASGLTSGIYFYKVEAGTKVATKKMVLK